MSSTVLIETTDIGRVIVPTTLPVGYFVFWTTRDFDGRLDPAVADRLTDVIRSRFGIEVALATCTQVHGAQIVQAESARQPWVEYPNCDALWSEVAGLALGIKVADCLPVTLIDPVHGATANIHSGWRGSAAGIVDRTVDALLTRQALRPEVSSAWLGPSIRRCCFEVGEEVVRAFAYRGEIEPHVDRQRGRRPYLDLVSWTRTRLLDRGWRPEAVFDSELCTRCEPSFHSWRREGRAAGRNLALAGR